MHSTTSNYSSVQMLFTSMNDQASITFIGLYVHTSPIYSENLRDYTINTHRMARLFPCGMHILFVGGLGPSGCLGFMLEYSRTRGPLFALLMMYGIALLSCFLKLSMQLFKKMPMEEDAAEVTTPSAKRKAEFQAIIIDNFPTLSGTYCVMDDLKLIFKTLVMRPFKMRIIMDGKLSILSLVLLQCCTVSNQGGKDMNLR